MRILRHWSGVCVGMVVLMGIVLGSGDCMAEKYPTFQVWGGSVFAYGNIEASEATLRGVGGEQYAFSSWTEYGVFANGYVQGLASGAASSGGISWGGVGDDFCSRLAPLSFANYSTSSTDVDFRFCNSNGAGTWTGRFGYNYPKFNMTASLAEVGKETAVGSGNVTLAAESITGRKIVATTGDVTIAGNLEYEDKKYYSLEEVPKLLIYANNIYIQCNVKRVDAILFASGTIDTCSDGPMKGGAPDYDQQVYSNQLTINGAIIAKNVNFKRTYGAVDLSNTEIKDGEVVSKCENRVRDCASIPAEIVNYDTSILVTGKKSNTTASQQVNLVTIYQRELPPRY